MTTLIRKEIRLIQPVWILALGIALLPQTPVLGTLAPWDGTSLFCYQIAALLLGIASFGREFSGNTFSLLLVQPASRASIWRSKLLVLGVGYVLIFAFPAYACWAKSFGMISALKFEGVTPLQKVVQVLPEVVITGLVGISSGLWTTLIFRQVAAAFWLSILIPTAIMMPVAYALDRLQAPNREVLITTLAVWSVYTIAGFWVARRTFMRAQDVEWTGGVVNFTFEGDLVSAPLSLLPRGRISTLIRKEFQLQQTTVVITLVILALHLTATFIRKGMTVHNNLWSALGMGWVLWMLVPMVVGATAVADERRLSTMDAYLCLPCSRLLKFSTKLFVALMIGTVFGGFVPALLESVIESWGMKSEYFISGSYSRLFFGPLVAAMITGIFFFASSLTRNLLHAIGAAIAITGLFVFATMESTRNWQVWFDHPLAGGIIPFFWKILTVVALCLAFRNMFVSRIDSKLWKFNAVTILSTVAAMLIVQGVWHFRVWELVMPLEPLHGPAVLHGSIPSKFARSHGGGLFVLLPDGRIWGASKLETRIEEEQMVLNKSDGYTTVHTAVPSVPIEGKYIPGTNWVELVSSFEGALALKSDGTLWKLQVDTARWNAFLRSNAVPSDQPYSRKLIYDVSPKLERVGTDSDWSTLSSASSFYLLVKTNGTLWGRGWNNKFCMGEGPYAMTNGFHQIGRDSDWLHAYADQSISGTGVKRDGTIWGWGRLSPGPIKEVDEATRRNWLPDHSTPVLFSLQGTNWTALRSVWNCMVGLDTNGTLWGTGFFAKSVYGYELDDQSRQAARKGSTVQVSAPGEWRTIPSHETILRRNGSLTLDPQASFLGLHRRTSRNSDWITVGTDNWNLNVFALAADGTLSEWQKYSMDFMMPSRKPVWNCNVLRLAEK